MSDIDNILDPVNDGAAKPAVPKIKKVSPTKERLDELEAILHSDPHKFDPSSFTADQSDLPMSTDIKYIDYDEKKKNHKDYAEQVILNIVKTYVKNPKTLEAPRVKDLQQNDVRKYARLLLMEEISEANLIQLQETIDGGDPSKEMFDSVNKAQQELRNNMNAIDTLLNKCDTYWKNYAATFGFENEEEKIAAESDTKDNDDKRVIVSQSQLTENIYNIVAAQKERERVSREEEEGE